MADLQSQQQTSPSLEESYKFLNLIPNADGSVTRINQLPELPPTPEIDPSSPNNQIALSKDIPLNRANKTYVRLYLPLNEPPHPKLPLILHFHGGGFVLLSPSSVLFHEACNRISAHVPCAIASLKYRLAPESRLPAAYEDAAEAVAWVRSQARGGPAADPWMRDRVDFSRVFLMGSSAGGNMVYRAALSCLGPEHEPDPIGIAGLVINQPFFGGVRRVQSEVSNADDKIAPPHATDLLWSLALPEGADRDHEYCNPMGPGREGDEEKIRRLPATVVRCYAGDPMVDRQKEFAGMLEARGVRVVKQFIETGHHAVEIFDPKAASAFHDAVKEFVCSVGGDNI